MSTELAHNCPTTFSAADSVCRQICRRPDSRSGSCDPFVRLRGRVHSTRHRLDSKINSRMDQGLFDADWYRLSRNMQQLQHDSADKQMMESIHRMMCDLSCAIEGLREEDEKPKKAVEIHVGNMTLEEAIEDNDELEATPALVEAPKETPLPEKTKQKFVLRYPTAHEWEADEEFSARLIFSASPLEFIVISENNDRVLCELEKKLERRFNRLLKTPLPREKCIPEMPCLVLHNGKFHRALIIAVGFDDVHLKIVDSGRTLFSSFERIFEIPSRYVHMAPPLATTCFLAGGDSRYMEADFVDNFNDIVNRVSTLRVTPSGVRHPRSGHPIVTLTCANSGEAIQCYNKKSN
ncbi:hypothetical protein QR680_004774 [Steinernema hermaphroditum]|uniref:Tudor domain-containing protein n=1 Tax=Steinernema hermaphroditum TaxID=289476 RepID=A0AA39HQY9_9BILA|nr:hypothetical protein QR680_004774 [Steinernema hermaphroditum]